MKKVFAIVLSLGMVLSPVSFVPKAHASSSGIVRQLVGIGNGIVGSSILVKCSLGSLQPSLYAYMGGSLAYLAGEIIVGKNKTQSLDELAQELDAINSSGTGGDYQRATLEAQLKNENSNLDFIQKRRWFVGATAAVYTIATILSGIEFWRSLPPPAGAGIPSAAACAPNPAGDELWVTAISAAYLSASRTGSNTTLTSMATGVAVPIATSLIAPKLRLASRVAGSSVAVLNTGIGRSITFGVMGGLVTYIFTELNAEKARTQNRIQTLQRALNALPPANGGLAESAPDLSGGDAVNKRNSKNAPIKKLVQAKPVRNCLGQDLSFSPQGCASKFKLDKIKLDPKWNIPTLVSAVNLANDFNEAIINGDFSRAEVLSGKLSQSAMGLNKLKDELLKRTNNHLASKGKPKIDLAAEEKKYLNQFSSQLASSPEGAKLLADAAASAQVSGDSTSASETTPASISSADMVSAKGDGGLDLSGLDNFTSEDEVAVLAALNEGGDSYPESSGEEIVKDPEVSIFKQVTHRYFLNYNKLFRRKELTTAPVEN